MRRLKLRREGLKPKSRKLAFSLFASIPVIATGIFAVGTDSEQDGRSHEGETTHDRAIGGMDVEGIVDEIMSEIRGRSPGGIAKAIDGHEPNRAAENANARQHVTQGHEFRELFAFLREGEQEGEDGNQSRKDQDREDDRIEFAFGGVKDLNAVLGF